MNFARRSHCGSKRLRLRPSTRERRMHRETSGYQFCRSGRPGPRATTPWFGRPASVPAISAVSRKAFPISEIGDEDPRESAKKRQKAPFSQSGLPTSRMPMLPTYESICVCPSVPARSAGFHKPLLKREIGDEHPPKPCQIVPNSATFSDQRNDPRPARTSSPTRELILIPLAARDETSHTNPKCKRGNGLTPSLTLRVSVPSGRVQYIALPIANCLTTFARDAEWATTPDVGAER
jgi:hypothetical protein